MTAHFAPRALVDIDELLAYVCAQDASAATKLSHSIERTIGLAATNPRLGSKTDEVGVFRYPIARYRITIFYRQRQDGDIEVVRVVRASRVKNLGSLPDN
jgi:plasmid stabilization system protein ParE